MAKTLDEQFRTAVQKLDDIKERISIEKAAELNRLYMGKIVRAEYVPDERTDDNIVVQFIKVIHIDKVSPCYDNEGFCTEGTLHAVEVTSGTKYKDRPHSKFTEIRQIDGWNANLFIGCHNYALRVVTEDEMNTEIKALLKKSAYKVW